MAHKGFPMTAKEKVRELLDRMGDDANYEEIQYRIYVQQQVQRGLDDLAAGRVVSQAEVDRRMSRWIAPSDGPK